MKFLLLLLLNVEAFASVAEPNVIWDHRAVKVCWGSDLDVEVLKKNHDEDLTAESLKTLSLPLKLKLQQKITAEFTSQTTGIHFIGWKSCSEATDADEIGRAHV